MVGGCCVCSDERGWAENPLVYCDGHACSVAVHQGTGVARGGRRDPKGGVRRAPSAAPSGDLLGLGRPSPTPPEGLGGIGGSPRPVLEDQVRHCFLAYCSSPAPPTPS